MHISIGISPLHRAGVAGMQVGHLAVSISPVERMLVRVPFVAALAYAAALIAGTENAPSVVQVNETGALTRLTSLHRVVMVTHPVAVNWTDNDGVKAGIREGEISGISDDGARRHRCPFRLDLYPTVDHPISRPNLWIKPLPANGSENGRSPR